MARIAQQALLDLGPGQRAFGVLRKRIFDDPQLLEQAVDLAVISCLRAARAEIKSNVKEALEAIDIRFIFSDWWVLMDGQTPLTKATKEQLLKDAERYQHMANGNARCAHFLKLIAVAMEANQVVHTLYAEEDLVTLWEQSGERRDRFMN